MAEIELGYWKIRGLAAPARMMAAYAGVQLDDHQYELVEKEGGGYDASAWFGVRKPDLAKENSMINLPYAVDKKSGMVVTQSSAVYTFMGRQLGLMGKDEVEVCRTEQAMAQTLDLRNDLMKIVYPFNGVTPDKFDEALKHHMEKSVESHYKKLDGFLGDRPFFAGDSVTVGDFHAWEMFDQHELMAKMRGLPSPFAGHPNLEAFHKRFFELPQLHAYFTGPNYKLPLNNKMANIK